MPCGCARGAGAARPSMNESGSIWPVFACVPALATRWRVQQLWAQFPSGVQYPGDKQVGAEWWTLWRRVAGCLAATEQLRLAGAHSPAYKLEIGAWLLARLKKSAAAPPRAGHEPASDSLQLWALGCIGARQPFHGHSHDVVPAEAAAAWVNALLALDWKRVEPAAFAAVNLARVTDDRTRDLPLREQVMARLAAIHAPPAWIAMLRQKVELDETTERRGSGRIAATGPEIDGLRFPSFKITGTPAGTEAAREEFRILLSNK